MNQVAIGAPVQYAAAIVGTADTGVTWSIRGASATENYGTISAAGVYTPPAAVPVHNTISIVATSNVDPTKSSSTTVVLTNPVPQVSSVTMTPAYHSTFIGDVYGSNFTPSSGVLVGYGMPTTYINSTHLQFTLASPPAAGTALAVSVVTPAPGRTQSATYSMAAPATVSVAVTGATQASIGTPVQYTAAVNNSTNASVTWSIVGTSTAENYGTISSTGLYTPPPTVPVHGQISIVATSQADATKSASVAVLLTNPVPTIASASLTPGSNGTYTGTVNGSNFMPSSAVLIGYGMPTTYVSPTQLTFTLASPPPVGSVLAVSVVTPAPGRTQSANYNLTVPAAVAVTTTGASLVSLGAPAQYAASVTGTTNTAVTWSIKGTLTTENYGTISTAGLYTPPPTVPVHGVISIIATSQADPTKSSAVSVTLSNPVPTITSTTLTLGTTGSYVVDVFGTNFMPASAVLDVYGMATTYISATHLQFTLASPPNSGTVVPISVVTPAPGRTQSANYNMVIPGAVTVTATGSPLATVGTPVQYTASVSGSSNKAVTWTITGTSTAEYYGTISAAGLYTPPQSVPVHPIITITATSQTDVTKSSSISVTISNPVPVITATNLTPAAKGTFLVDVLGSNFMPASQVMDVYGVATSFISATHLQFTLTAPPAAGTVVPISVVTPAPGRTQSANFSMVIPGAPAVVVTGSNTATIGTPVQYTAAVSGVANTAVTWSIVGTLATENYGTISQTGLYTPPPAAPVHGQISIVATSQAVTTTSGSVSVLLTNPTPVITSATLTAEYHSTFLVDVYGTGFMPSSAVLYLGYGWATTYVSPTHLQFTLTNPPAAGTVEALGVVTPAPGRTQSANFNVTIPGLIGVTVTGAAQSTVGIPVQLTANVTGTTNTAVNWSVNNTVGGSSTYGTISASGLYTPPSVVPPNNVVTILATSQQDATKTGSTTVTLSNVVPTITSATTSALANHQILVTVTGTNFIPSSSVQFQGYGLPTTYISPTSITGTITTAQTAGADVSIAVVNPAPGKTTSASYTVQLPGQVGVTVVGAGIVAVGSTAEYAATLTGTTNTAVNWSVSAANGAEAGSISSTGVYTPPTSISANLPVTITATSQVEPSSTGSLTVTLVSVPAAAAARLLEQSTFGPTDALIAHVQTIGLSAFIDEQLALPPSLIPLVPATLPARCTGNAPICIDEDWWNNAINAPDQLRQRVANALGEQFVISYREANGAFVPPYVNMLVTDAFGNWSTIMKDVTLSPGMGEYLNMVNSGKPPAGQIANENFARENMQLFNLGTNLLNQDGTLQTDSSGNPIPAYTEAQVEAFSRVFTGWTWAAPNGGATPFPNWNADPSVPMVAIESAHDTTSKVLLNTTLPAGQTAEQDLAGAIQDVFNHPNVGPFVAVRLIQHLVKSNPTPAYVGRIAAVFANDGTGVRGNMAAVVKAILLDPEARAGDTNPVVTDGYMREPLLWTANVLRALNATPKPGVTDDSAYNALDTFPASQGETIFGSPTVFNFYPPQFGLMDTGLNAPQFALETSATIMQKLTLASNIVNNLVGALSVNLSATSPLGVLAASGDGLLLDELNTLFMHGQMSSSMRTAIENVISQTTDPAQKVRMAVYLVITSTQYKIIH